MSSNNAYDLQMLHIRVNELQESLQLYERLNMKNEFMYTLRLYTMALLNIGDMVRMKELLIDYKFMVTWEDERMLEHHKNKQMLSQESAQANLMSLFSPTDNPYEEMMVEGGKKLNVCIERPN